MFKKIKNKIKNYLSPIFKPENRERGIAGMAVLGAIWFGVKIAMGVAALFGGLALWNNWGGIDDKILNTVLFLLFNISSWAVGFSGKLLEAVISSEALNISITRADIVVHGWTIVRDFTNMFIVLGFVVIGIATILRIREYQAQKTLLPLILVALLINFSPLLLGIIIDAANITMDLFLNVSGPESIVEPIIHSMPEEKFKELELEEDPSIRVAALLTLVAFNVVSAMVFFLFAFLFVFRHVALMILVILSPLAFLCYVFKATKGIWTKWWNNFFQWSIIGIPAAFFIYLAGHLIAETPTAGGPEELTGLLSFWVPMGFLLFGYMLCFQTGALGAGAAIRLAKGTAAVAFGAGLWVTKKGGKGAAGLAGRTKTGAKIKEGVGNFLETIRIRKRGTIKAVERKKIEAEKSRIKLLSKEERDEEIRKHRPTREGQRERVAALEVAAENGELTDEHKKHVTAAKHFGLDTDQVTKSRPDWIPDLEPERVKKLQGTTNPSTRKNYTETEAKTQVVREAVEKMSPRQFRNDVQAEAYNPEVFAAMNLPQLEMIGKTGSQTQKEAFKKYKTKKETTGPNKGKIILSKQTQEYQNFYKHMKNNFSSGSPEWKNANKLLKTLSTDKNFN